MLYDTIGIQYTDYRRPDPRISELILREIGPTGKIVNVGAGVGSYEPSGRDVVAVEPSWAMISQRTEKQAPVVQALAERLPFKDRTFDVATAILTIHHWSDIEQGLREMSRVTNGKIILLTWIGFVDNFWLLDYLPQIKKTDEPLFPTVNQLTDILGPLRVIPVRIPHDCTDGFLCAYWRRPRFYLDEGVRRAISSFSRITDFEEGLKRLRDDPESGRWSDKYQAILARTSMDFGYRLVVKDQDPA
ncbi:MAG: class I SAM-dependent methyltransferase [Thermodesulfobacteriota bacterium]